MADEQEILNRWRLVLGKYSAGQISFSSCYGGGLAAKRFLLELEGYHN